MKGYNVVMDNNELKVQALLERLSQESVRSANEIADLRVSLTNALTKIEELEKNVPGPKQEFTAETIDSN